MADKFRGNDGVTFTVSKRNIERIAIIIATVLITLLIAHLAGFGDANEINNSESTKSTAAVNEVDSEPEGVLIQEVVEDTAEPEEEVTMDDLIGATSDTNDTESNETEELNTTTVVEEEGELSGDISMSIGKVEYVVPGDNWASIRKIVLHINNQKEDFDPLFYVYIWDDDTPQGDRNIKQGKYAAAEIKTSTKEQIEILNTVISIADIDEIKTIKVEFRDASNKKIVTSAETTVMIS